MPQLTLCHTSSNDNLLSSQQQHIQGEHLILLCCDVLDIKTQAFNYDSDFNHMVRVM